MTAKEFKIRVLPISNKLLRFAVQMLKNEEEAKDLVQDVFLKLWQKRDELEKLDNIEWYAMRMVRNACLDYIRLNRSVSIEKKGLRLPAEGTVSPSDDLELSETAQLVRKLIRDLPELQGRIMWLRDIEQYDYDEIAEMTDLNANAIRVNLSRARKKVRDELLKHQNYGLEGNQHIAAEVF